MSDTSSDSSSASVVLIGVLAILCCAGPFIVAALAGSALLLLIGAHQTMVAVLAAATVVVLFAAVATRARGNSLLGLGREAFRLAFAPPAVTRSVSLMLLVGVPLTLFYLVALPAERFGALAWGALQFLTAGDAIAAAPSRTEPANAATSTRETQRQPFSSRRNSRLKM